MRSYTLFIVFASVVLLQSGESSRSSPKHLTAQRKRARTSEVGGDDHRVSSLSGLSPEIRRVCLELLIDDPALSGPALQSILASFSITADAAKVANYRSSLMRRMTLYEFAYDIIVQQSDRLPENAGDVARLISNAFTSRGMVVPHGLTRTVSEWYRYCVAPRASGHIPCGPPSGARKDHSESVIYMKPETIDRFLRGELVRPWRRWPSASAPPTTTIAPSTDGLAGMSVAGHVDCDIEEHRAAFDSVVDTLIEAADTLGDLCPRIGSIPPQM